MTADTPAPLPLNEEPAPEDLVGCDMCDMMFRYADHSISGDALLCVKCAETLP